jgi:hypothetical protein
MSQWNLARIIIVDPAKEIWAGISSENDDN